MTTVNVSEAGAHLSEIISGLNPGEQVVIVQNGEPMAMLTRSSPKQWPCTAGSAKDTQHSMSADFDAPLDQRQRDETLEQAAGLWHDRNDLPDFAAVRQGWDRGCRT